MLHIFSFEDNKIVGAPLLSFFSCEHKNTLCCCSLGFCSAPAPAARRDNCRQANQSSPPEQKILPAKPRNALNLPLPKSLQESEVNFYSIWKIKTFSIAIRKSVVNLKREWIEKKDKILALLNNDRWKSRMEVQQNLNGILRPNRR